MATKQFKAESKRLLNLMINSIYTHKEIFLRELISNASDAIDKLHYRSLTEELSGVVREDFAIRIVADKKERLLTVSDNGQGMTKEELESNLGTIAKSGSLDFKNENEKSDEISIIGQFGVGFYSAFMVADCVTVTSRAYGTDEAWKWESHGADGYTVTPCEKTSCGTDVVLKVKEKTPDENYDDFLDEYRIKSLVKKYSDYIRYPIKMNVEHRKPKEGKENEYETVTEEETLNSMIPLWKKNKSEVTPEDYAAFYKEKYFDYEDPLRVIHSSGDGATTFNALLFVPAKTPMNYYTREYEKGLQLYANGVLIMDKCADLLPDCFSFVKGLVDSQDLSLNISREMLQHDRQLKVIAARLQKKIKSELLDLQKDERENYEKFFKNFGIQLKYGIYSGYGASNELLRDLLLYHSSFENKYVTLAEYVSRMKEEQKYIYYATGENVGRIDHLPQTEVVKDKGFEILYMTDDIDEFAVRMLGEVEGKEFRSVSGEDLGLESEEEKKEAEQQKEESHDLLTFMKEALGDKVSEVRLSKRLKTHPVCLASDGEVSLEMEKVLNAMPNENKIKAQRVLELNASHPVFATLNKLLAEDKDKLNSYSEILYTQALLIEGIQIEDPVAFSNAVCDLMSK